ncbi:MAG: M15 family metallopeptidase [Oscillospiraceae bacterium]|nr:M15 family metallopeptidase [Oscillospiraceae bacterium]
MRKETGFFVAGAIAVVMTLMVVSSSVTGTRSAGTSAGAPAEKYSAAKKSTTDKKDKNQQETRAGYVSEIAGFFERMSEHEISYDGKEPLFKDSPEGVTKAWRIGLIDDGDTAFYYEGSGIQYQTAAQLLYEAVILAKPAFSIGENEARYMLNGCYDNIGIEEKNLCGVAFLYKYGIADRRLSPEAFMTAGDTERLIDAAERLFANKKEVKIAGRSVSTGMSRSELIRVLGNPGRTEDCGGGFVWYVYNSNYNEFIAVGVYNELVAGFFTNCRDFSFGNIKSGSMYADTEDDDIKYYLDWARKIDGIFYSSLNIEAVTSGNPGADIVDMINSARAKRGAAPLYFKEGESRGQRIGEIGGKSVWECYGTLVSDGYGVPFEFARETGGYLYTDTADKDGITNIVLTAEENKNAAPVYTGEIPEKKYYGTINKALSNIEAPVVLSPGENAELSGDVTAEFDLKDGNYYRLTVTDNETLEIVVNSYIAYADKIVLPSYLFKEGGDYILAVYTPDGEKSNFTEFAYGTPKAPEIISPKGTMYGSNIDILWKSDYSEVLIEVFDKKSELIASSRIGGSRETSVSGMGPGEYMLRISALKKNTNTIKTYSEISFEVRNEDSDIIRPPASSSSSSSVKFKSDRYSRIFGPGRNVYSSKKEADANIVSVTVPVWKLEDGRKVRSTEDILVNRALAQEVYDIFYEIYMGSERFPIKSVSAYSWRSTATGTRSQHSYGTAIDINANENYCIYNSGRKIGSFWKPGENPYSIPKDGDVVRAFKSRGWTWGAEWNSLKDYMHFSYLGG